MIKRLICLVTAVLMTLPAALAAPRDLVLRAKANLTEIYGYTPEEADSFEFQDDGKGMLRYWPRDHPEWVYTQPYLSSTGETPPDNAKSPFYNGRFFGFPGESAIRDILRTAEQKGWFRQWDKAAIQAFYEAVRRPGSLRITTSLAAGLESATITAAQAIDAFFVTCLGEPHQWAPAVRQWRDTVLARAGLSEEAPYRLPEGQTINIGALFGGPAVSVTQFGKNPPEVIKALFQNPHLSGWHCMGGVLYEQDNQTGRGMAAFEKEGRRLLVMMMREEKKDWQLLPVGENALHKEREMRILADDSRTLHARIEYPLSPDETEAFILTPAMTGQQGRYICKIERFQRINLKTGEAYEVSSGNDFWTIKENLTTGEQVVTQYAAPVYAYLEAHSDLQAFPATADAWFNQKGFQIPEGYAMLSGVHLRQKTSSRSRSLGMFNPGTLAKALGQEKGDPFPWLHAQIGLKTGYISTSYVNNPDTRTGNGDFSTPPLPVARAKKNTALKTGTGLFDGTVKDLPQGTRMHVLCEEGGWLYVVVPRGEIGWLMDVEGAYGYVGQGDVTIAPTKIQLDWQDALISPASGAFPRPPWAG